jgi:hypothetical protein
MVVRLVWQKLSNDEREEMLISTLIWQPFTRIARETWRNV